MLRNPVTTFSQVDVVALSSDARMEEPTIALRITTGTPNQECHRCNSAATA